MTGEEAVKREMALICVNAFREQRSKILQIVENWHAKVVDISSTTLTMEVTCRESGVDELLLLLKPFGVVKPARSGVLALYRES